MYYAQLIRARPDGENAESDSEDRRWRIAKPNIETEVPVCTMAKAVVFVLYAKTRTGV